MQTKVNPNVKKEVELVVCRTKILIDICIGVWQQSLVTLYMYICILSNVEKFRKLVFLNSLSFLFCDSFICIVFRNIFFFIKGLFTTSVHRSFH